jgi:hypothetical protein
MTELARAIGIVVEMRAALEAEVVRARKQRMLIRNLDADGLFKSAQARAGFNARLATLETDLAEELRHAALAAGLGTLTLESVRCLPPPAGAMLADGLGEVQALGSALHELDALNRILSERALACVRGYLDAVAPKSSAYDRRGAATSGPALPTASRVA